MKATAGVTREVSNAVNSNPLVSSVIVCVPGWKCARNARGCNGVSRNRAQLRYNAPFLARFHARCKYALLRNLAVYRAMLTNTSGLFCIPLASLRETNPETSVYAHGHDVGLQ